MLWIALWTGVVTAVLPLGIGWTALLGLSSPVFLAFAGALLGNLAGMDAALDRFIRRVPVPPRVTVIGRQLGWLLVVLPGTVLLTVLPALITPTVAPVFVSGTLAALAAGWANVGLLGVLLPAPDPDHRDVGPFDSVGGEAADSVRIQILIGVFSTVAVAAPGLALTIAGSAAASGTWEALRIGLSLVLGGLWAVMSSFVAGALLERRRTAVPRVRSAPTRPSFSLPERPGTRALLGALVTAAILLTLPQGAVALGLALVRAPVRSWFLALYAPAPWNVVLAIAAILAGIGCALAVVRLVTGRSRREPELDGPQR